MDCALPCLFFLSEAEKALYQQHSFNEHLTPSLLAFPLYSDVHMHCPESPDRHRSMKRVMAIKMKTIEVIRSVSSIDLTKILSVCVLVQWIHVCQHVALTVWKYRDRFVSRPKSHMNLPEAHIWTHGRSPNQICGMYFYNKITVILAW